MAWLLTWLLRGLVTWWVGLGSPGGLPFASTFWFASLTSVSHKRAFPSRLSHKSLKSILEKCSGKRVLQENKSQVEKGHKSAVSVFSTECCTRVSQKSVTQ